MLQTHLVFNEYNPVSFGSHAADVPSQDGALDRPIGKIRHDISSSNDTGHLADKRVH